MNSASSTTVGNAIPRQARMMWNPSVVAICARAGTTSVPVRATAATTTSAKRITILPGYVAATRAWAAAIIVVARCTSRNGGTTPKTPTLTAASTRSGSARWPSALS